MEQISALSEFLKSFQGRTYIVVLGDYAEKLRYFHAINALYNALYLTL
jgi:hypothetical protein